MKVNLIILSTFILFSGTGFANSANSSLSPEYIALLKNVGAELKKLGKTNMSTKISLMLADLEPQEANDYMQSLSYAKKGDYETAIKLYNSATRQTPDKDDKYYKCLLNLNKCDL